MPRPLFALLCLLVIVASLPAAAVPPALQRGAQSLPEGALLGLEEEAAQTAAHDTPPRLADGEDGELSDEESDEASPGPAVVIGDDEPPPAPAAPALSSSPAVKREVVVPVRLDLVFLRAVLIEQVFVDGGRARFDMDEAGCNTLELSDPLPRYSPASATHPAGLRVRMRASARIGVSVFGGCTGLSEWNGQVEVLQTPHVLAGGAGFGLGVADSLVLDANGEPSAAGALWDWIKNRVQPRLGAVSVDLREALGELRGLLPQVLQRQTAEGLLAVLESVRVADAVAAENGVVVSVVMTAPVAVATPAPAPLSAQELARFRAALANLDGFFTFVTRTIAGSSLDSGAREALLATLIDGRYRLLEALEQGVHGDQAVQELFVELWDGLAPLLARLPGELPAEQGLRFLAFVAAGDVLRALQGLGPGTGLDISADGLRRLARLIAPAAEGDPLQTGGAVDEDMRRRFGFGAPLPAPVRRPAADPEAWLWPLQLLLPAARAEGAAAGAELSARLADWAPRSADLDAYLPLVRDLLDVVAATEQEAGGVPPELRDLFRTLLLSVAWQESCWRQFVHVDGRVTTLTSPAGALGLMQVSAHVWRGFYDVDGLAGDIAYNARAGAEIARHYLLDYALPAGEQRHDGGADNLARATYAAYNGGPRQLARYRKSGTPARLRAIDEAFHSKYRLVKEGDDLAVAGCYTGG